MPTAFINLRGDMPDRQDAFLSGLMRIGYGVTVAPAPLRPKSRDILVCWNRIHATGAAAKRFEESGNAVIVAENATWGNDLAGRRWYTLARGAHNTAGKFPIGGPERWASLGVELAPWRRDGTETVILASRGIGQVGQQPIGWMERAARRYEGRVRPHPGQRRALDLFEDLKHASRVVTWGSGAAVTALRWGIPVVSHMPEWIAECESTDDGRQAMFERLAWGQWELHEIASGEPFARLLA